MAEQWIKEAINPEHKGMFSAKAKKAGMSTSAYIEAVLKEGSKYDETTKKQAQLAKTLMGLNES